MDEYHQLRDHEQMYRTFMLQEKEALHTDPREVFKKLSMDDATLADLLIEMLSGPRAQFNDRCQDIVDDCTESWVHHLIDVELGVD